MCKVFEKLDQNFNHVMIHTGQHYDDNMSQTFFDDLGLPPAGINLGVGSGSHAEQTAAVMLAYEKFLTTNTPDWIVVVGDVNSTLAVTLTAKKLKLKDAHLEAGLRSFDRTRRSKDLGLRTQDLGFRTSDLGLGI